MRPRFSLRWLFLGTALFAVFCYWLILPTVVANRFVRALAEMDYKLADTCFRSTNDRFLFDSNEKHWHFKAQAELGPRSFAHLLRGQRIISLTVMYGDAGPLRVSICTVIATRRGLLTPLVTGGTGGGGGIDAPLIPTAPIS